MRQIVATALALTVGAGVAIGFVQAQEPVTMAGTAKDEGKKPFPDYAVRAREVEAGQILGTTQLDELGTFRLTNLKATRFVIELTSKDGKVICTEGPFDMTKSALRSDIVFDCDKIPAAWRLLGAAAAAGIPARTATGSPASPSR
jgi:hypothetical protein